MPRSYLVLPGPSRSYHRGPTWFYLVLLIPSSWSYLVLHQVFELGDPVGVLRMAADVVLIKEGLKDQ